MASHEIPNRGPELVVVNYSFMAVAVTAFLLRGYVRVGMVKAFGRDDILMGISLLFFLAYGVSSLIGVRHGTGRHHADLSDDEILHARRNWWFCYLFYSCSTICSKISIGFFLLRIAVRKIHTWVIYGAMMVSVLCGAAFFFVTMFQCNPVSFFWTKHIEGIEGTCVNMSVVIGLAYLYSSLAILSDFTFALLPALLVMNLQLARKTKYALVPLLTMGCVASAAVVARLPYLQRIDSPDFLWATLDIAIWSTVEQGLAIIAGSLATCRPLFAIALFKLGLGSYPTKHQTPIFGGTSTTANRIVGGHRANQPSGQLDMYRLPSRGQDEESASIDSLSAKEAPELPRSPNWYQTQFDKVKRGSLAKPPKEAKPGNPVTIRETSSEESLRGLHHEKNKAREESLDEERGMQIMVSRSFFVTDAERASYAPQDGAK
ncbi:unnamed protein product [Periconia digitata]|uniref:Rhodopsin domain-containing protein n=1 Tax=Periconia digitata TaxID=1303443 RepID=A0A9W4XWH9_9PLEO|nr:unnamed protein product [Periconia digitata]